MKAPTDRQMAILGFLRREPGEAHAPNRIAMSIGLTWTGKTTHNGKTQGPAQQIIGSLNGLAKREYIGHTRRPDGLSGTAYYITTAGMNYYDHQTALEEAVMDDTH